jgi:ubiquinol-cytochrome c reductase cytochrome c subunit
LGNYSALLGLRIVITFVLAAVLAVAGPAAAEDALVREGHKLYVQGCISCHGPDGEGVAPGAPLGAGGIHGEGPPLRGVGAAAVDLYLSTGYMPLRDPADEPTRSTPDYTREEIDAIVAYVVSLPGTGPGIPEVRPERGDLSEGFEAYTSFCAGCHQSVGEGGMVTGGIAPPLKDSTPTQIGEAIRTGPYLMPPFGEQLIDDRTVDSIARYLEFARDPPDEGGWGIGHLGPVPEGAVAWLIGAGALVAVALVIGKRAS